MATRIANAVPPEGLSTHRNIQAVTGFLESGINLHSPPECYSAIFQITMPCGCLKEGTGPEKNRGKFRRLAQVND
jgi:hypothetical protein